MEEEKVSESKATWVTTEGRGSVGMSGWLRAGGKEYVTREESFWISDTGKSRSKGWGVGLRQSWSDWGQDSGLMQTTWAMQSLNHYIG